MNVWQAESLQGSYRETYGVFSTLARARGVCQGVADEYYGRDRTVPLRWTGDDELCVASYHHPANGMYVFCVTRRVVDGVVAGDH